MTILIKTDARVRSQTDIDKLREFADTNRIDIRRISIKTNSNEDLLTIDTNDQKLLDFCRNTLGLS